MADPILLDTQPLRDQRTMCDVTGPEGVHQTTEDVEAAWARWADREGLTTRRRHNDWTTELRTSRKTIVVYVSGGKWIGDCPECNGGVAAWPCNPRGCCLDCGTIFRLEYPPVDEIPELVELLAVRPLEQRNYHPHLGETISDARAETDRILAERHDRVGVVGVVQVEEIRKILGDDAVEKLMSEGAV